MRGVATSPEWVPACMDPDELEEYRAGRSRGCQDCTVEFSEQMVREGRCNGIPGPLAHLDIIPLVEHLEGPDGRTPILNPDGTRRPFRPSTRKEHRIMALEEPTRLQRRYTDDEAIALAELAAAASAAADYAEETARIRAKGDGLTDRLDTAAKAAGFNKRTKPGRKTATRRETSG